MKWPNTNVKHYISNTSSCNLSQSTSAVLPCMMSTCSTGAVIDHTQHITIDLPYKQCLTTKLNCRNTGGTNETKKRDKVRLGSNVPCCTTPLNKKYQKKKQIVIRAIARRSYTCITGCRLVATHLNGWLTSMVNGHKNYGSSHKALAHNGAVSSQLRP